VKVAEQLASGLHESLVAEKLMVVLPPQTEGARILVKVSHQWITAWAGNHKLSFPVVESGIDIRLSH
jgi:hypothetical protein